MTSNFASARRRLRSSSVGRHRLEVAERLVEVDARPRSAASSRTSAGAQRRADQVVLEQLDAVEAGRAAAAQLLLQRAAQAARWRSPLIARATSALVDQRREVAQHALAVGLARR